MIYNSENQKISMWEAETASFCAIFALNIYLKINVSFLDF